MTFALAFDVATLAAPVQRVLAVGTPPPLRAMAARGAVPGLRPDQVVAVIAVLAHGELAHVEPANVELAQATFAKLPPPLLQGALGAADLPACVVDLLARTYLDEFAIIERIVVHPAIASETAVFLASHGSEAITELVAVNEERLLQSPAIIDALYMNKKTRMSTADRIVDLAARNGVTLTIPSFREAVEALEGELISLAEEEPTPDDLLFHEADRLANEIDDELVNEGRTAADILAEEEINEEGDCELKLKDKAIPLDQRIRKMNVSHKVRLATLGSASARALLIRDKNRTVSMAAVRSPLVQEQEIVMFSSSRVVGAEILRVIGNSEFTRNHQVKFNVVSNPKTPLPTAMKHIAHLQAHELKRLASSKGVSQQICKIARQELQKKQKNQ